MLPLLHFDEFTISIEGKRFALLWVGKLAGIVITLSVRLFGTMLDTFLQSFAHFPQFLNLTEAEEFRNLINGLHAEIDNHTYHTQGDDAIDSDFAHSIVQHRMDGIAMCSAKTYMRIFNTRYQLAQHAQHNAQPYHQQAHLHEVLKQTKTIRADEP